MSLILLIDLDDTLISNSMDTFIPAYLQALGKSLAEHGDPDFLISKLLSATEIMMKNKRPDVTLKDTFDENYYLEVGVDYDKVQPAIGDFYSNHFPSLQPLTESISDAVELVEKAFKRGYKVVIATNSIPKTAIYQRLEWGNLSPDIYDYSLVSYFERFHFAKPNPAYFAEILAHMGWPDLPVIMIGNDKQADIDAARSFKLPTYWINPDDGYAKSRSETHPPFGVGGLDGILDWIDSQEIDNLKPQYDSPSAITAILSSTPAMLDSLIREACRDALSARLNSDEWSLTEIFCHLRDVDKEIYLPRIQSVLSGGNPFIEAVDSDRWALERKYDQQDGSIALHDFISNRKQILAILESLAQNDWDKEARHTIFGPTTLLELLRIFSRHDRLHVQQIYRTLDQYRKK